MAKKKKNLEPEAEKLGAFSSDSSPTQTPSANEERTSPMSNDESFGNDSFTFQPDFSETHDEFALPAGTEVRFEIRFADIGTSQKTNSKYIRLGITIPDEPNAKDFNEFLMLPNENDDPKTKNRKNLRLRNFMDCVGLDASRPFGPVDLIGLGGWAILGMKDDPEYGEQNNIKKYLTGK